MRTLSTERRELIEALVAEADIGGISASLLEKDEHLTAALKAIFELKFDHASLVFCGGTSLSKAHGLIDRMSEDADIKIVLTPSALGWPKSQLRRYLGDEVRPQIIQALQNIGLTEDEAARQSLNDNQYLNTQWAYLRSYHGITALRPNLQIELTARAPVLPTSAALLECLTDKLAERTGLQFWAPVVSIEEIMAEKVLSFLRRFAQHRAGHMQQKWDTALVRHIYDVHCIVSQKPNLHIETLKAFSLLTAGDVDAFGYQDTAFAANPKHVLSAALHQLKTDVQSRNEYQHVLLPLVYGKDKFSFDQAMASFDNIATRLVTSL